MTATRSTLTEEEKILMLKEKEAALRRDIQKREKALQEKKRKLRTRELIEKGGLIEIAGLLSCEPQLLTGALFHIAKIMKDEPEKTAVWRQEGARILSLSPAERKEKIIL
jgi:hypothetical protein